MGMPAGMCGRENRAPAKHVDILAARFSDAGSIPAASTKIDRPVIRESCGAFCKAKVLLNSVF